MRHGDIVGDGYITVIRVVQIRPEWVRGPCIYTGRIRYIDTRQAVVLVPAKEKQ